MATRVHEFDWPDRAVIGTLGVPGDRTFYLQVRAGQRLVSVALEKQQSAQLAEKIDEILDQLISVEGNPYSVPSETPRELIDNDQLEGVEEHFRAGAMGLGWDPTMSQLVLEAYPMNELETDDTTPSEEMLLLRMPVGAARAFAQRTREIVGAGRPICLLCGEPMDPDGHSCTPFEN